jgi:hypothetical protein
MVTNNEYEFCANCENDIFRLMWTPKGYETECTKCGDIQKLNENGED